MATILATLWLNSKYSILKVVVYVTFLVTQISILRTLSYYICTNVHARLMWSRRITMYSTMYSNSNIIFAVLRLPFSWLLTRLASLCLPKPLIPA